MTQGNQIGSRSLVRQREEAQMEMIERQGQEVDLNMVKQWKTMELGLEKMAGKREHPHEM